MPNSAWSFLSSPSPTYISQPCLQTCLHSTDIPISPLSRRTCRHNIWRRAVSGAPIEFLTAHRRPTTPGAQGEIWRRVHEQPGTNAEHMEAWEREIDTYHTSLIAMAPSPANGNGNGCGRYSTRVQITEIAATCRDAHQAVESAMRTSTAKPLYVFETHKTESEVAQSRAPEPRPNARSNLFKT